MLPHKALARWTDASLSRHALEASSRRGKLMRIELEHGTLPEQGWDEATVQAFLLELSALDSNNFAHHAGAGEREGRVYSRMVAQRHFGLAHGVGRSGDVAATQPKAAGSSTMVKLTQSMARDAIRRICNVRALEHVIVLPVATGMALTLCFLAVKTGPRAVWTRMDQKTCVKALALAGCDVVVVDNVVEGDAVRCDVRAVAAAMDAGQVGLVVSTTSGFAPRVPDDVVAIALLCKERGVPHVINNAYGLQCSKCCHLVQEACRVGRVDAVVQSTDKNFLVPVGGALVASPSAAVVDKVSKLYPGRASAAPCMDLFLTLLAMGADGLSSLLKQRAALSQGAFNDMLRRVAERNGERVLETKGNTISFAVTLSGGRDAAHLTEFGSMLFTRGVSGARVVPRGVRQEVSSLPFAGFGSSCSAYPHDYFTVACAIGMTRAEVDLVEQRLNACFEEWRRR